VPLDKAVLAVSTTGAADDKPDPATARSGRAKAIIAPSRWYKKCVIGEGRMNGHHNGNGYKGWARRQARRRNGHG